MKSTPDREPLQPVDAKMARIGKLDLLGALTIAVVMLAVAALL